MTSLDFPKAAGSTVDVSVIVGGHVTLPTKFMIKEQIAGHNTICAPSYGFLDENKVKVEKIPFDIGLPNALKKLPPSSIAILDSLSELLVHMIVLETLEEWDGSSMFRGGVADQLREEDVLLSLLTLLFGLIITSIMSEIHLVSLRQQP
ncbi:hypothetical protein BDV10DRAFT_182050 [Aspergillus recurvatus]